MTMRWMSTVCPSSRSGRKRWSGSRRSGIGAWFLIRRFLLVRMMMTRMRNERALSLASSNPVILCCPYGKIGWLYV